MSFAKSRMSLTSNAAQGQVLYDNNGQITGASVLTVAANGQVGIGVATGVASFRADGAANVACGLFVGNATSGQSFGLTVRGGTTSADACLQLFNQSQATQFLNVNGVGAIQPPVSPLAAATTQIFTGLAGFRSSDNTATNNTLTADAQLTLTFNETGHFAIEIWLAFWEVTTGTGGFQFDLNSGTSTVGGLAMGLDGFSTVSLANVGVTSVSTASSQAMIATAAASPSWFLAKGWMNITGTGTRAIRWAQNTTSANATTLLKGSYFTALKIG